MCFFCSLLFRVWEIILALCRTEVFLSYSNFTLKLTLTSTTSTVLCISSDWFISNSVHFMNFWANTRTSLHSYSLCVLHPFVSFACVSSSRILSIFSCSPLVCLHHNPNKWTDAHSNANCKRWSKDLCKRKQTRNQHDKHRRFSNFFQGKIHLRRIHEMQFMCKYWLWHGNKQ